MKRSLVKYEQAMEGMASEAEMSNSEGQNKVPAEEGGGESDNSHNRLGDIDNKKGKKAGQQVGSHQTTYSAPTAGYVPMGPGPGAAGYCNHLAPSTLRTPSACLWLPGALVPPMLTIATSAVSLYFILCQEKNKHEPDTIIRWAQLRIIRIRHPRQ